MPEPAHIAFPLRPAPDGVGLLTVEDGTLNDVRQCVHVLTLTPLGARPLAPEVGVVDPTFTAGVQPQVLQAQLEQDEPRAAITVTTTPPDRDGREPVQIRVALKDT